jgi:alanine dehydrogenase
MRVGVPTEVKNHEYRVAITPQESTSHQARTRRACRGGRRTGSPITDDEFTVAGAKIASSREDVWQDSS